MQLTIDESEQTHIYSCLLVGNVEFGKVKKSLAKLNREDDQIDEEIALNAKLRRIFNPRAEEEARAKSRNDPAQLDIDVASSGETGGGILAGQTVKLNTGPATTLEEVRDGLLELGIAVMLDVIDDEWSDEEFAAAGAYVEAQRALIAAGESPVDGLAPECVERDGMGVARLRELLAVGPYRVEAAETEDIGTEYEVGKDGVVDGVDSFLVEDVLADKLDAEIRAARLNRTELQRADLSDDEITEWGMKGPWMAVEELHENPDENEWIVAAGTQKDVCESKDEAYGRAARYNRSIAERSASDVEPMYEVEAGESERPPQITDDQARETAVAAGRAD
jgi:hypothetical protein